MFRLPQEAGILNQFSPAFTQPTFERFLTLLVGAIVTMGRRTVSHVLFSIPGLCQGHCSSYSRLFSASRWSLWPLARILAKAVVALVPKDQPVVVDVDDTIAGHSGRKVFGVGTYRDPIRSSRSTTHLKRGHKWVVMAINVSLPLCLRPWALPVLVALSLPPAKKAKPAKKNAPAGKKAKPWSKLKARRQARDKRRLRKTPATHARQMIAVLLHWFPQRKFILLGDWGFASHDLALFCLRHRDRLTLIARTRSDMRLYAAAPPAKPAGSGRRQRKGVRLPPPAQSVAASAGQRARHHLRWYGNSQRDMELLSACGNWYRGRGNGKAGLAPVRWVCAHDPKNQRDDYFYSTDPTLTPRQIVELFAARWAVEVTFEEAKGLLGFESTRQRCRKSVLRSGPCLMGLFSVISLIYAELARSSKVKVHRTPCYAKTAVTFADALAAVRTVLWKQVLLLHAPGGSLVTQLPNRVQDWLLAHLAAAA